MQMLGQRRKRSRRHVAVELQEQHRDRLRVFVGPSFRDAVWRVADGGRLEYDWDEAAGERAVETALALVDEATAHPCGRLTGIIAPGQVDTCTAKTL